MAALGAGREDRDVLRVGLITAAAGAVAVGVGLGVSFNRKPTLVGRYFSEERARALVRRYNAMLRGYYGVRPQASVRPGERPGVRVAMGLGPSGLGFFGSW